MDDAVIETARLWLRPPRPTDAEAQFQLLNTPAVMEHLGGPKTLDAIAAKHAKARALFASHGYGFMMAVERASGDLVGHCGLKHVDHPLARNPGEMEIGWIVRADRWRRGYAREAAAAVLDWGFARFAPERIVALTGMRNTASWRLMAALGLVRCPELDFADPDCPAQDPTVVYAATRAAWPPGPPPGAEPAR